MTCPSTIAGLHHALLCHSTEQQEALCAGLSKFLSSAQSSLNISHLLLNAAHAVVQVPRQASQVDRGRCQAADVVRMPQLCLLCRCYAAEAIRPRRILLDLLCFATVLTVWCAWLGVCWLYGN